MTMNLFDKYGGFAQISKVVGGFYDKAIDSDIIGPFFDDIDLRKLIDHQTKFVASVMGGPASYSRDALGRVHQPLAIDAAAFAEMTRLLRETLQEFGLEEADVDHVMNEIESFEPVIVVRRSP